LTISLDPSLLSNWYGVRAGLPAGGSGAASTGTKGTAIKAPAPPWATPSVTSSKAQSNKLQTAEQKAALANAAANKAASDILSGHPMINVSAATLSVSSANPKANSDYKNLFALYQGVTALETIATQAGAASGSQLLSYQKAFASGLTQLQSYLSGNPFSQFSVALGAVTAKDTSTATVPVETDSYQGPAIYSGDLSVAVPSLSGNVAFSANVKSASGATTTVNFDLSEMGATPRTLPNVVTYLNSKLEAAGLKTVFQDVRIPGVSKTVKSGNSSYTLPAPADSFALRIAGTPGETLTFSASGALPAVHVAQTSGATVATQSVVNNKLVTSQPVNSQVITGLTADPSAPPASPDQIYSHTLGTDTTGPAYQATGPDGSLYVVTTDTGAAPTGQSLPSAQNVVLTKYDSTGQVVYSRTLGSAGSATAYAIAVSPDGSRVAVAGSVSGALTPSDTSATPGQTDSFVAAYDAQTGSVDWISRAGTAGGNDTPSGIAFDANGSVYVSGQTSAAFPGQTLNGAQDGFVQAFSATGVAGTVTEFGTAGVNSTAGVTVSGSTVVVAGVESGHAVLRDFTISGASTLTPSGVRDLGDLSGGNLAGISTAADGTILVAGSTHNGALAAGTVTSAYGGGKSAFVAKLAPGGAGPGETLAYYSAGGDTTATAVTTANGIAYVAGQVAGPPDAASNGQPSNEGFVTAIDPATGQAIWSNSLIGDAGQDRPSSVAVAQNGSSVLNLLGLPSQTIEYVPSPYLVDNSGLQAGDSFTIGLSSGVRTSVTIDPTETLQTLAAKINHASQGQLTASVGIGVDGSVLNIKPANSRYHVTLGAGPADGDALVGLGIAPGELTASASTYATVSKTSNLKTSPYALGLTGNLDLSSASDIAAAQKQLAAAQNVLKVIYIDLTTRPLPKAGKSGSSAVSAHLAAQIADYRTALARLQGASSSSTTVGTLSLFG
jgi:Beta-propeller repeat